MDVLILNYLLMTVAAPDKVLNTQRHTSTPDSMLLPSQGVKDALARIMSLDGVTESPMALPSDGVKATLTRY